MTTPKEALELKPCPFCGKPPKVIESGWHAIIRCDNEYCGADVEVVGTERGAVLEFWNTRATASLQGEDAVERVARIIDPETFAKYDAELVKDRRAENGRRWADVCHGEAINRALAKARRILATGLVPDEAAVRADERERCARVAEERVEGWDNLTNKPKQVLRWWPDGEAIAAAIRSNGRGA